MAELLCPVCGEANPVDGDICQFCQAQLHPSSFKHSTKKPSETSRERSPSQESERMESGTSDGGTTQNHLGNKAEELTQDSYNEGEPEWLHRIREKHIQNVEPESIDQLEQEPDLKNQLDGMPADPGDVYTDETPDNLEDTIDEERIVETVGPLIGLKGVIDASPILSQIQEPPVRSIKLQITDKQQSYADLLQQLINHEGYPQPVPQRRIIKQKPLGRIIVAVLLILAVLFPIVFNGFHIGTPNITYSLSPTRQLIDGLQDGAPVLTAFDYQPGLSGEMDAVFAPVIDHLLQRGAYLTLVSTEPTGPLQAERLLAIVKAEGNHEASTADRYINLGYLPAGATGLVAFAQSPDQVLPMNLEGDFAWLDQPLRDITSLRDFELVIVATENPDTAQAWIEQVKPELGDTPLILVVSAQAEPVVRPYYEANPNQIQGLVGGLTAGVHYESLQGGIEIAGNLWDSFSLGVITATVIILIGLIVGAFTAKSNLEDTNGEEKP